MINFWSFIYNGWIAKIGAPVSHMKFNLVDKNRNLKTFPLCLIDIQGIGKLTSDHEENMTAAVTKNDNINTYVLVL